MVKVILKIKEENLDFILKQFLRLAITEIKIKKKASNKCNKTISIFNTYDEPDK
ncbi:Uncharacterised protein [Chryseobacterium nakagawai]|nr:Uncharacterised protein [Chryseobacterium nakagawai]